VQRPGFAGFWPFTFVDLSVSPRPVDQPLPDPSGGKVTIAKSTDPDGTLRAKVTVHLSPYAVISGKITSPDGLPMEHCLLEFFQERPPVVSERDGYFAVPIFGTQKEVFRRSGLAVQSNDQGEFRAATLEPGTYYVAANCSMSRMREPADRPTYYPRATHIASAGSVELRAGQSARADIQISAEKGVRIAGRLRMSGAAAQPSVMPEGTQVALDTGDDLMGVYDPGTIGKDDYEFKDVLPGKYILLALTSDGTASQARPIEVGSHDMEGVDLELQPPADLSGAVTFRRGCTPRPVKIRASSHYQTGAIAEATSDADGKFVLHHMPPGRFKVVVSGRWGADHPPHIRLGSQVARMSSPIGPPKAGESLQIELTCNEPGKP